MVERRKINERWLPVPDWDAYEVSDWGRVRWIRDTRNRKKGMLVKLFCRVTGHQHFIARQDGKEKFMYVHRLVALLFVGPQPSNLHEVAHDDNDGSNNRYKNLIWKTHAENMKDKYRFGTVLQGSRHGRAKLTEKQVLEIRIRVAKGETQTALGIEFSIDGSIISDIHHKKLWKHI